MGELRVNPMSRRYANADGFAYVTAWDLAKAGAPIKMLSLVAIPPQYELTGTIEHFIDQRTLEYVYRWT